MEMKTRLLFVPLLLALVASVAACGGSSQQVPANSIAVVDGKPITRTQFNDYLEQALNQAATTIGSKPAPGTPQYTQIRNQVISELVEIKEVEQQSPKEHVAVTPSDVDKFIANLVTTNYQGSQAKLIAALKAQGLTLDQAKQQVYVNLLASKLRTKVTSGAKVTEKQERDYYNSNLAQYNTPASSTRNVEHILVKSKGLANLIERKLQNGESFATLAKKYSKDPGSAAQGGRYTATEGREVPAYDSVAFALKNGQLSKPVDATSTANGGYGYFIIRALAPVNKTPAHTQTFKEAQATIQQTLLTQAQDALFKQWLDDLIKTYQGKVSYQSGFAPPATTALSTTAAVTTG
jgi:parvulin-like peptidyl-prolyl isomerase